MNLWVYPYQKFGFWPYFQLLLFFIIVILTALSFVVILADKNEDHSDQNDLDYGGLPKPERKIMIAWVLLLITMMGLYILFNGY